MSPEPPNWISSAGGIFLVLHSAATMTFALSTVLLAAGPAFTQTASSDATRAVTATPIADIYVQTQSGVNVYK